MNMHIPSQPLPGHTASHASPVSLVSIIGRIEEAIERETLAIRTDVNFDIKQSNIRKSRYLYELTKAMRGMGPDELRPEHRDGMVRLREKLERNEQAIRAQLNAVSEVASIIQSAIQKSEGDGTYSAGAFGGQGAAAR
ncbi:hypothetical protein [Chelativorans sp. ZYF759]|uniref:hypothetical protein n=1 Tax=Chelativorans sp. ZYF759 TaxID=2692213 RepID=UPI001AEDCA4F|nr:hypothetical protein [Chelativorans sp. ZYF759]